MAQKTVKQKILQKQEYKRQENEEKRHKEFNEHFHRYLPKSYSKVIACTSGFEIQTWSIFRLMRYPDDVAAKKIAESVRSIIVESPEVKNYMKHDVLERKIGISVITDKSGTDDIVFTIFTGLKERKPTLTPAWKPLDRKLKQVKTTAGSNPKLLKHIRSNIDSFNRKAIHVEVVDAQKTFYELIMKDYNVKIEEKLYDAPLPQDSDFSVGSSDYFKSKLSKPLCYYSIQKDENGWTLKIVSGMKN